MAWPPETLSIAAMSCCGLISVSETGASVRMLFLPQTDLPPPGAPRVRQLRVGRARGLAQQFVEFAQNPLHIAHDGHIGRAVLPDLRRVDIHVDHLGVRREGRQPAGHAVVEARAQGDQQVGALERHVGGIASVHARHADEVGVFRGHGAQTHQRGNHRQIVALHQFAELRGRAGGHNTAPRIDQRPLGFSDQLRRAPDLAGVAFGEHFVSGEVNGGHRLVVALALEHVLGDIHQHRPGTPA